MILSHPSSVFYEYFQAKADELPAAEGKDSNTLEPR